MNLLFCITAVDTLFHHIYKSSSYSIFQTAVNRQNARRYARLNPIEIVLHLNRQDVFDELMKIYGKDRSILSYQLEVSLVDETAKFDGVGRKVCSIFLEQLLQGAFDEMEEYAPINLPEFGMEEYEVVGKILYHFLIFSLKLLCFYLHHPKLNIYFHFFFFKVTNYFINHQVQRIYTVYIAGSSNSFKSHITNVINVNLFVFVFVNFLQRCIKIF